MIADIKVTVDIDEAAEITRQTLVYTLETIEFLNQYDDVPVWDAINEVVAYFSTPDQLKEMELRTVSPSWIRTVLLHDADKLEEMGY